MLSFVAGNGLPAFIRGRAVLFARMRLIMSMRAEPIYTFYGENFSDPGCNNKPCDGHLCHPKTGVKIRVGILFGVS